MRGQKVAQLQVMEQRICTLTNIRKKLHQIIVDTPQDLRVPL